jgi:hypothetical protein
VAGKILLALRDSGRLRRPRAATERLETKSPWCLTEAIIWAVDDVKGLSRMGRAAAARHLSQIAAECLEKRTP